MGTETAKIRECATNSCTAAFYADYDLGILQHKQLYRRRPIFSYLSAAILFSYYTKKAEKNILNTELINNHERNTD